MNDQASSGAPDLLGALVAKAAATEIIVRQNAERDRQDAALLLATIPDPIGAADECDKKDRHRLWKLDPLTSRDHRGWDNLDDEAYRRGTSTLAFLLATDVPSQTSSRSDSPLAGRQLAALMGTERELTPPLARVAMPDIEQRWYRVGVVEQRDQAVVEVPTSRPSLASRSSRRAATSRSTSASSL